MPLLHDLFCFLFWSKGLAARSRFADVAMSEGHLSTKTQQQFSKKKRICNGQFCTSTTMLMCASYFAFEQVCASGDRSLGQHVSAKRGNVDTRASTNPIGPKSESVSTFGKLTKKGESQRYGYDMNTF